MMCFGRRELYDREAFDSDWTWYTSHQKAFKLTIEQCKRIALFDPPPQLMGRLQKCMATRMKNGCSFWAGDQSLESDCCLLESVTVAERRNEQAKVTMVIDEKNKLDMDIGIAALLMHGDLTHEQKYGLAYRQWEVSRICGNWQCVMPQHLVVETKTENRERKRCFERRKCPGGNVHTPRCYVGMQKVVSIDNGAFKVSRIYRSSVFQDLTGFSVYSKWLHKQRSVKTKMIGEGNQGEEEQWQAGTLTEGTVVSTGLPLESSHWSSGARSGEQQRNMLGGLERWSTGEEYYFDCHWKQCTSLRWQYIPHRIIESCLSTQCTLIGNTYATAYRPCF